MTVPTAELIAATILAAAALRWEWKRARPRKALALALLVLAVFTIPASCRPDLPAVPDTEDPQCSSIVGCVGM